MQIELDKFDIQIIKALQQDARSTHQKLARDIPLSPSQIGRRLQRLEDSGLIEGYHLSLRPEKIGLSVTAFVHVSLERHGEAELRHFSDAVAAMPEILECYATAGEADYLMRVVVRDLPSLSRFVMNRLMSLPLVRSARSTITLEAIKSTRQLPL